MTEIRESRQEARPIVKCLFDRGKFLENSYLFGWHRACWKISINVAPGKKNDIRDSVAALLNPGATVCQY